MSTRLPETSPETTGVPFRSRNHPVAVRSRHNPYLNTMLADIPEYLVATATAERAAALAVEIAQRTEAQTPALPTAPEQITPEWIDGEVARRRYGTDSAAQITLLGEVEFGALQQAWQHIEQCSTALIEQLANQLHDLIDRATVAAGHLGDEVGCAADAIDHGTSKHWKTLSDARRDYDILRDAQRTVYRCDTVHFDRAACGDENQRITDPEARLYYHRNLSAAAPGWRGHTSTERIDQFGDTPWPTDPVEKLLWFIRNDTGIWCPTPRQITDLLASEEHERRSLAHAATVPDTATAPAAADLWNTPRHW
ncbi:hypothetical protein [Mycobacterium sp. NPDC050853]|uniref:hypothetical protein n=1 Tax=Mycobacterium sp. NPDC050853 TaxID=3155160 RepID=UPI0034091C2B